MKPVERVFELDPCPPMNEFEPITWGAAREFGFLEDDGRTLLMVKQWTGMYPLNTVKPFTNAWLRRPGHPLYWKDLPHIKEVTDIDEVLAMLGRMEVVTDNHIITDIGDINDFCRDFGI